MGLQPKRSADQPVAGLRQPKKDTKHKNKRKKNCSRTAKKQPVLMWRVLKWEVQVACMRQVSEITEEKPWTGMAYTQAGLGQVKYKACSTHKGTARNLRVQVSSTHSGTATASLIQSQSWLEPAQALAHGNLLRLLSCLQHMCSQRHRHTLVTACCT